MTGQRIVIRGGLVLDAQGQAALQDVLIEDGSILAIDNPGFEVSDDTEILSAADRLLIPGLISAHTHSHGALNRGAVGDKVSLEMFLTGAGASARSRGIDDKYLSAALSAAEMIRKGCTACFDLTVEFPAPSREGISAVARAYRDAGMRAVIAPMIADRTIYQALPGLLDALPDELRSHCAGLRATPIEHTFDACRDILANWEFDRRWIRPALGPTIPLHCSDEFLIHCARLASEHNVPLQTHLAESRAQAAIGRARYGNSLVAHLQKLGLLSERLSAAHAIWLDDDDIARLGQSGVRVAHNPSSNLRLGSGVAPVRRMLEEGIVVGVGTDASNTSDGQNMFEATRLASYLSRIDGFAADQWLSAAEAFHLATQGSAKILGFEKIGRLAPGYEADIVFLRLDSPHFVPLRSPLIQMVFAENGASVHTVMIGGRIVFHDGKLLSLDESLLRRQAQEAASRLDQADANTYASAATAARLVGAFCAAQGCTGHTLPRKLSLVCED
ncbi:MAG: 5-methylthioadenosine/S-adenosylhomocysteine deaminase [Bradyrhizobium sp.]|jgi:5-methylthioadenosine/S-adenosylhomocysteine deaminase|nr:5-methylthioadenosine/S-adenosylhomocysteine deaminase [Bradyrhizobium sp.]